MVYAELAVLAVFAFLAVVALNHEAPGALVPRMES